MVKKFGADSLTRRTVYRLHAMAILCLVAAATGGFWLVISIFVSDYRNRKGPTR